MFSAMSSLEVAILTGLRGAQMVLLPTMVLRMICASSLRHRLLVAKAMLGAAAVCVGFAPEYIARVHFNADGHFRFWLLLVGNVSIVASAIVGHASVRDDRETRHPRFLVLLLIGIACAFQAAALSVWAGYV